MSLSSASQGVLPLVKPSNRPRPPMIRHQSSSKLQKTRVKPQPEIRAIKSAEIVRCNTEMGKHDIINKARSLYDIEEVEEGLFENLEELDRKCSMSPTRRSLKSGEAHPDNDDTIVIGEKNRPPVKAKPANTKNEKDSGKTTEMLKSFALKTLFPSEAAVQKSKKIHIEPPPRDPELLADPDFEDFLADNHEISNRRVVFDDDGNLIHVDENGEDEAAPSGGEGATIDNISDAEASLVESLRTQISLEKKRQSAERELAHLDFVERMQNLTV